NAGSGGRLRIAGAGDTRLPRRSGAAPRAWRGRSGACAARFSAGGHLAGTPRPLHRFAGAGWYRCEWGWGSRVTLRPFSFLLALLNRNLFGIHGQPLDLRLVSAWPLYDQHLPVVFQLQTTPEIEADEHGVQAVQ